MRVNIKTAIYVIDDLLLFNPILNNNGLDVYRYKEIERIQKPPCTALVFFETADIESVLYITDKMQLIFSVFHPLCIVLHDDKKKKVMFLVDVIKLLVRKKADLNITEQMLLRVKKELNYIDRKRKIVCKNPNASPLYIKTTMAFGFQSGGAVSHSVGVITSLRKCYRDLQVYTTDFLPEDIWNANVHHLSLRRFNDFLTEARLYFNISAYAEMVQDLKEKRLAFVYQRCCFYDYLGLKIARRYNIPFVLEWNGSDLWVARNYDGQKLSYISIAETIERLNLEGADLITCVSEELKEELVKRGISENKILANVNGVDTNKFNPQINGNKIREKYKISNETVIGFVGSFAKFHGAEVLAKAFGELIKQESHYKDKVKLLMIGEGNTLPEVKRILKRMGVSAYSICTGSVETNYVPEYLAACDILVAPHVPNEDGSEFFGSPTKLFEYMAMGKAIIASRLNQIGQILSDNVNALLFEPGNISELKDILVKLVNDEELRDKLGIEARKEVLNHYTWDEHVERIIGRMRELDLLND